MSNDQLPSEAPPDVLGSAKRLMQILREDSANIDTAELARGERMLALYQDPNFGPGFKNIKEIKAQILQDCIMDLSDRARMLSKAFFAVVFANNQLEPAICDYGEKSKGTLVFKIALRDVAAFQRWRGGESSEITGEDLHSAIYYLIAEWAKI